MAAGALGKQFWGVSMRPQELQGKLFGACRGDCRGMADGRRSFGENVVVSWGVSRAVSCGRWRFSECMESWTVVRPLELRGNRFGVSQAASCAGHTLPGA